MSFSPVIALDLITIPQYSIKTLTLVAFLTTSIFSYLCFQLMKFKPVFEGFQIVHERFHVTVYIVVFMVFRSQRTKDLLYLGEKRNERLDVVLICNESRLYLMQLISKFVGSL